MALRAGLTRNPEPGYGLSRPAVTAKGDNRNPTWRESESQPVWRVEKPDDSDYCAATS